MNKIKKVFYVTIGLIAFVLGSIGAFLPILPTTPFLLLAAFCFVRGSKRFDQWFKQTTLYKNCLEQFVNERAMTFKHKMRILLFADFMLLFPLIILDSLVMKSVILCLMVIKYYYFMVHIKKIPVEHGKKLKKKTK